MSKMAMVAGVLLLCSLAMAAQEGQLTRVALEPNDRPQMNPYGGTLFFMSFSKADEDMGAVNPHAVVSTANAPFGTIWVAVDSTSAEAGMPDVLRIDFSGQGKFDKAVAVELSPGKTTPMS